MKNELKLFEDGDMVLVVDNNDYLFNSIGTIKEAHYGQAVKNLHKVKIGSCLYNFYGKKLKKINHLKLII